MSQVILYARYLILIAVSLALMGIAGCGDLSRDAATGMIKNSSELKGMTSTLAIKISKLPDGEKQGLWNGSSKLTSYGRRFFDRLYRFNLMSTDTDRLQLTLPTEQPVLEISGISEESKNVRVTKFKWHYSALPSPASRFALQSGTGEARFQRYDNGWRVEGVRIEYSDDIPSPSQNEQALIEKDVKAKQELHNQSLRATKTLYEFSHYASVKDKVIVKGIITDAGITFTSAPDFCLGCTVSRNSLSFWNVYRLKISHREYPGTEDFNLWFGSNYKIQFLDATERDRVKGLLIEAIQGWQVKYQDLING